jgi:hypothetical protein
MLFGQGATAPQYALIQKTGKLLLCVSRPNPAAPFATLPKNSLSLAKIRGVGLEPTTKGL